MKRLALLLCLVAWPAFAQGPAPARHWPDLDSPGDTAAAPPWGATHGQRQFLKWAAPKLVAALPLVQPPKPRGDHDGLHVVGDYTLVVTKLPFKVVAPGGADLYFWRVPATWTATDDGATLTVDRAADGTATVGLQTVTIDWAAKKTLKRSHTLSVTVGSPAPPPPPPVPDNPLPSPEGLRALIVEETSRRSELPQPQQLILLSEAPGGVRQYLREKCPPSSIAGRKEWAIYDPDQNVSGEPSEWVRKAFARPRQSLPWLVASSPKGFHEGPLPADSAATLAVLKKLGG